MQKESFEKLTTTTTSEILVTPTDELRERLSLSARPGQLDVKTDPEVRLWGFVIANYLHRRNTPTKRIDPQSDYWHITTEPVLRLTTDDQEAFVFLFCNHPEMSAGEPAVYGLYVSEQEEIDVPTQPFSLAMIARPSGPYAADSPLLNPYLDDTTEWKTVIAEVMDELQTQLEA